MGMMMMMTIYYDESVWRKPLLPFSVLFGFFCCWVCVVSDRECRRKTHDFGYVLVVKPCPKQFGAFFLCSQW